MIGGAQDSITAGLIRGARENWCMNRGCTTCGSFQMFQLLTGEDVANPHNAAWAIQRLSFERAKKVVAELRECPPYVPRDGVMWLLFAIWQRFGDQAHEILFPPLDGTYAGSVLSSMREHYARVSGRR